MAYLEEPPMATMLILRELPPYGGDTLYASTTAAFEALTPTMWRMMEGLSAVNTSTKVEVTCSPAAPGRIKPHALARIALARTSARPPA